MNTLKYFLICFVLLTIFYAGCDSSTDSKPISVSAPVLVSPADTSTGISLTPTFTWTGSADKIQIDLNNNTFANIIHSADVTGSSYVMPAGILVANHTYYWRAGLTAGSTVYWCNNIYSFRTGP